MPVDGPTVHVAPSAPGRRRHAPQLRGERATIAEGTGTAAVGMVAPLCVVVPPPGSWGCAVAAAAAGPGLTYFVELAQKPGRCLAAGHDLTTPRPRPTTSGCDA